MPNKAWPGAARVAKAALLRFGPAEREVERGLGLVARGRKRRAFVQHHLDIGAEQALHLDGALRRQLDGRAVDMRLENDAPLVDAPELRQRHHLVAAGIGEDRLLPMHELVQAAELGDALGAGPQHQVIGVGEDDVGAGSCDVLGEHGLDRGAGADRHEGRRANDTARRGDGAGARLAVSGFEREGGRSGHAPRHPTHSPPGRGVLRRAEQAGVAIGIKAIARLDGMRIDAPHQIEAGEGADQHEQG